MKIPPGSTYPDHAEAGGGILVAAIQGSMLGGAMIGGGLIDATREDPDARRRRLAQCGGGVGGGVLGAAAADVTAFVTRPRIRYY